MPCRQREEVEVEFYTFLTLATDQLHAMVSLPLTESLSYPLDRKLARPQSQSGYGGKKEIMLFSLSTTH
jgi:hypothetical protein